MALPKINANFLIVNECYHLVSSPELYEEVNESLFKVNVFKLFRKMIELDRVQ